jgi:hypothetical protein
MNTNASNSYHMEVEGNPLLKDVNVFPAGRRGWDRRETSTSSIARPLLQLAAPSLTPIRFGAGNSWLTLPLEVIAYGPLGDDALDRGAIMRWPKHGAVAAPFLIAALAVVSGLFGCLHPSSPDSADLEW